ncbi:MAG: carboxypeptidase regulatory-like domain-containing protein [Bacteroidota bacterium]|nr:carboxypeptidase regulatory-like domain-containing protein [Bacteroidota bacterium]
MSKFTKVSLMLLVFLVSGAAVFAQQYELSNEQERIAAEQMLEQEHGPTVVVPPSQGSRAIGDDCSDPIIVTLPNDLPYSDVNYTCGRGNNYDATCLGLYDGGEDIIYQIVVTSQIELEFTFDPQGTTYTGFALLDDCPDVGTCIAYQTGSSGTTPKVLTEVLDPGTYYLMADTWPSPACIPTFSLNITEVIPPPPLDPIAAFPYMEDFEAGDFPSTMQAEDAPSSHIFVSSDAAYNSSYGSLFDGGATLNWSGGSTSTTYDQAFNTNTDHIASINMLVEPDGTAGQLLMEFDLKGNYSFGANYSWFRVLVDGVAIDDMEGNPYFMAEATNSEDDFDHLVYDLSAYQGLSSFTLTLQSSCKYDYLDYRDGDYWMMDNFDLYFLQLGDVEGYTFNGDGLIVNGANVWVTEDNATVSGVDGYYLLTDVAYGPQDLMGWKDGYNVVTYPISIGSTTAYQDIVLTQPTMIIYPLQLNEELNPNEFLTTYLGILNQGDGPLFWEAVINYTGDNTGDHVFPNIENGPVDGTTQHSIGKAPEMNSKPGDPIIMGFLSDHDAYLSAPADDNFYSMDMTTYTPTLIGSTAADLASGDFPSGSESMMYGAGDWGANLYTIDVATGSATLVGGFSGAPAGMDVSGIATDKSTGTIYVSGTDISQSFIGILDETTGAITQIGSNITAIPGLIDIAIDGTGQMYGWGIVNDESYLIDKATGDVTLLGSLGFDANYGQGGNWDPVDDIIYLTAYNLASGPELRTLDRTTGGTSLIQALSTGQTAMFGVPGGGGPSGGWLSLGQYEGNVNPSGGSFNLPVHFDAAGFEEGDYVTAEIVFTSTPDVGTITIPVSMTIIGDPLTAPENLSAELVDMVNGTVELEWEFNGDLTFEYFRIEREGVYLAQTTSTSFVDVLPDYGTYCYEVKAVYDEGMSSPAGPECVDWLIPDVCYTPATPEEWVWEGFTEEVSLYLENCGDGILEYSFPAYEALNLLNDPAIEQNTPGSPFDEADYVIGKDQIDPREGGGYPIVLGAGGPDDFGYVWIDSDETGGPDFNWIDISTTGTEVTGLGDDDIIGPFNIGFNFPFYGEDNSQFWINSNGVIGFTDDEISLTNSSIPTGDSETNFIAWFWDDLDPAPPTQIFYENLGNMLVIQFEHYFEYPDGGEWVDAEMILYPTGQIKIQYDYFEPGFDMAGMTIGLQSPDQNVGLQVAYNTSYAHDGLALMFDLPAHFIIDVEPAHGFISSGSEQEIIMTYSAENYGPGTYTEDLDLITNALAPNDELAIPNIMHVYTPAQFAGTVTDANTSGPIEGAIVRATYLPDPDINFSTSTNPTGDYTLVVDPGDYMVEFDKVGYQSFMDPDTNAAEGVVTPLDAMMWEELYKPGWVTATVNENDTECLVEWSVPWGAYEVLYDDGSADDYLVYSVAGNAHAVKFTPAGYPATIMGGSVFVGDGSFPVGSDFLGSTFGMALIDDDGTDGMPGTVLDSIEVEVDNYGWIDFADLNATITDGDFYLAMFQGSTPPNAAPIGIDQTIPTVYRSYTFIGGGANIWSLSAYQDFMIRAIVAGPQSGDDVVLSTETVYPPKPVYYDKYIATGKPTGLPGTVKSGEMKPAPEFNIESGRDATGYKVARFSDFNPDGSPLNGDTSLIQASTTGLSYNDQAFSGLPEGWYAYGVAARYNQGGNVWSDYAVSNIVGHLKQIAVTVNVTTTDGSIADSVEIVLTGLTYPYETYTHFTDETATVTFDPVWKGTYDLWVYKPGYDEVLMQDLFIIDDETYDVVLGEKKYAPYNLYVDPLTSIATWNAPRITALKEGFEGEMFPPEGWTATTNSCGWYRTDDGSGPSWPVPAWDSYYAVSNDDLCGSGQDGSVDYLITPALDLRETGGYSLKFDQFFDGAYGQLATVEISTDGGATWEVLENMTPTAGAWTHQEIDLSAYSNDWNIPWIWIAFHSDDAGGFASGWAIDNVDVSVGSDGDWPPMGYHVFLDDAFVAEVQEETYTYLNLVYGVEYTASVGALYTSGLSEKDYYTFTSEWLYPPENLAGVSYDNAVHLIWEPPCAPWFDVLSTGPRMEMPNPNTEYSPVVREIQNNYPGSRDLWDTQFEFPCGDASGEAGVESDGNYIYTTKWNAGNGTFFRYGLDGTFMGSFVVSGGPADIRDLAYDGEFFYGSNAGSTVWGMDFDDEVLVETISAPVSVRAIAYDEGFDGFWANNWSDAITLFDRDGVTLNSFMPGSYISYYGFAYDEQLPGGPYLYGFSQSGSGAVIVELEIATGTETGVTYDAIGFSTTGTGLAGGLFIQDGIVPQKRTLGGIIQNETIFGLEFGDGGGVPTTCDVPDNVIGFNVYRDGAFQEYVEYFGEEQISWWQYDMQPACYDYEVTAVYDLSPYGQFGEEGESMVEGPANICVSFGFPLPFMEDWEAGTFENKDWEVQCDNWDISTVIGNDGNSATFQWDPIQENYDCGMITYPLLGNDVVDGDIYLDFDLKIDDRFDTVTTELMTIRVWADGEWTDITSFAAEGDKDWESHHINISTPAKGYDFRVGFFANGENSLNIDGWYVDNVHVYQLCAEPFDLTGEKVFETQDMGVVELNWVSPGATVQEWISYNDGTFENAIASTEGGAGLAQMFTPEEYPVTITEVRYFNSSFEQYMQENEIWILAGDGSTVLGGPYYVEDGPADDWVNVDIDDVTLNSGTFMVATFNVMAGGPYVGMDDSFYDGSLYFGAIGDLTEMGEFGYFFVGSHEALVEYEVGDNVVVNSVLTAPQASNNNQIANVSLSGTSAVAPAPASRELTGYNIWRNDELIETNWPDVTYSDTVYEANQYCYYVSAVYDQCESDTVGVVCEDFYLGLGEETSGVLEIYPNPTRDDVTIESPIAIERITVLNYLGQVVYDATVVEETTVKLDVSAYESGVYFIKVETEDGLTTERVTVTK